MEDLLVSLACQLIVSKTELKIVVQKTQNGRSATTSVKDDVCDNILLTGKTTSRTTQATTPAQTTGQSKLYPQCLYVCLSA